MVYVVAFWKAVGAPVRLPFEVMDTPFGRLGLTLTLAMGPPLLTRANSIASRRTSVRLLVLLTHPMSGAISMTSKPTEKVCVVESVTAEMV